MLRNLYEELNSRFGQQNYSLVPLLIVDVKGLAKIVDFKIVVLESERRA